MSRRQMRKEHTGLRAEEGLVCDVCGRFGAYRIGDRALCLDCYEGCGSCCPEFGKDDLWQCDEKKSSDAGRRRAVIPSKSESK